MHKLIYPVGEGRINYITRRDIARGIIAILKQEDVQHIQSKDSYGKDYYVDLHNIQYK
jgi:uncharacterized protein YbjT (DUF2867 family)